MITIYKKNKLSHYLQSLPFNHSTKTKNQATDTQYNINPMMLSLIYISTP